MDVFFQEFDLCISPYVFNVQLKLYLYISIKRLLCSSKESKDNLNENLKNTVINLFPYCSNSHK